MKYATWFLHYGTIVGVLLLIVSVIVYIYIYAYIIRILKRIDSKLYLALIANSYIFAFGLFSIFLAMGVL